MGTERRTSLGRRFDWGDGGCESWVGESLFDDDDSCDDDDDSILLLFKVVIGEMIRELIGGMIGEIIGPPRG